MIMLDVFSEAQKFVKEATDAVDMFAFMMEPVENETAYSKPPPIPPQKARLTKKASLPSNGSMLSTNKSALAKSQGKLQPLNKDIANIRYSKTGQGEK